MVCLYPYDREIDPDPSKLLRLNHDSEASSLYVLTYNMRQVEKADRYLYGDKDDITNAIEQYEVLKTKNGLG